MSHQIIAGFASFLHEERELGRKQGSTRNPRLYTVHEECLYCIRQSSITAYPVGCRREGGAHPRNRCAGNTLTHFRQLRDTRPPNHMFLGCGGNPSGQQRKPIKRRAASGNRSPGLRFEGRPLSCRACVLLTLGVFGTLKPDKALYPLGFCIILQLNH